MSTHYNIESIFLRSWAVLKKNKQESYITDGRNELWKDRKSTHTLPPCFGVPLLWVRNKIETLRCLLRPLRHKKAPRLPSAQRPPSIHRRKQAAICNGSFPASSARTLKATSKLEPGAENIWKASPSSQRSSSCSVRHHVADIPPPITIPFCGNGGARSWNGRAGRSIRSKGCTLPETLFANNKRLFFFL